ncbi:MAG TPA: hypothetical protein PKA06_01625, partial [Gemmatales bacterium]|nr:hypothetical protein [Gemmatales bacterium]
LEALLQEHAVPFPSPQPVTRVNSSVPEQLPTEDFGDPTARIGSTLAGKYKLIEAIGEGGMGSVYLAQQMEPV